MRNHSTFRHLESLSLSTLKRIYLFQTGIASSEYSLRVETSSAIYLQFKLTISTSHIQYTEFVSLGYNLRILYTTVSGVAARNGTIPSPERVAM